MDGDETTAGDRRRANARPGYPGSFDWLEGATGVRVRLSAADGLVVLTVEGDLDRASLGVIESIALQALVRSPARVELDLKQASCFGDDAIEAVARLWARARLRHVPFYLKTPRARENLLKPGGA